MTAIGLRNLRPDDGVALFEWMRDPVAVELAAFTAKDPDDRDDFDRRFRRLLEDQTILARAVELTEPARPGAPQSPLVGMISSWGDVGERELTYWIDRRHWGRGVATAAVDAFVLKCEPIRPLHARVAIHNLASLHVLLHAGFVEVGREHSYAAGAGAEIEELLLELDADDALLR